MSKKGALPYQYMLKLFESGCIEHPNKEKVQPSSLDLCLSDEVYMVNAVTLPFAGESIRSLLPSIGAERFTYEQTFRTDQTYLIRLCERLQLPDSVYGSASPKSSIGRVFCHTRLLADGVSQYDTLPAGFSIFGRSFRIFSRFPNSLLA